MQPVAPVKTENVQPEHGLIGSAPHAGIHKCDVNLHFKSNSSVTRVKRKYIPVKVSLKNVISVSPAKVCLNCKYCSKVKPSKTIFNK